MEWPAHPPLEGGGRVSYTILTLCVNADLPKAIIADSSMDRQLSPYHV